MVKGEEGRMNEDEGRMTDEQAEYLIAAEAAIKAGKATVNELADAEEAGEQLSIGELLARIGDKTAAELLTPERKEQVITAVEAMQNIVKDFFTNPKLESLRAELAALETRMKEMGPFLEMVKEAYDKEAFFWHETLWLLTGAIDIYVYDNRLESATDEQKKAHKEPFLAFFSAYLQEWQTVKAQHEELTDEGISEIIWEGMHEKGHIKGRIAEEAAEAIKETLAETAEIEKTLGDCASLLHGPGLDELAKLGRKTEIQKNPITGTAYVTAGNMTIQHKRGINVGPPARRKALRNEPSKKEEGLSKEKEAKEKEALLFQRYISTVAATSALKLLDISTIKLTEQNGYRARKFNTNVEIDVIEDFMKPCGIPITEPSIKKTKGTLRSIQEAWNAITLDFMEKRAGREGESWHINILQKYEDSMANGKVKLQFTEDIAEYLTGAYLAHFPLPLLKTDERNDNVYRMGRRLMLHYSNVYNQEHGTADIISVKALLESAPAIPTYEEVMGADKHLELRIMRPFKAALDKLDFIEWEYCNAKKTPLTKKQKAAFNYHTFIGCYVKFTVLNGPDMKRIVAEKQEKTAQAEERKRARAEARKKKGDA